VCGCFYFACSEGSVPWSILDPFFSNKMMHCSTALSKKKKTQAFLCFHKIQVTKMTKVLKPFLRSSSRDSAALLHQVWKLLEGLGGLFLSSLGSLKIQVQTSLESSREIQQPYSTKYGNC
jgi:hypothetical protein